MRRIAAAAVAAAITATGWPAAAPAEELTIVPAEIERSCRGGRAKLYDECGDQRALFDTALAEAKRQGKVLLVSYGAEWCIWCHVFHDYVTGVSGSFTYTYSDYNDAERVTSTLYERALRDVSGEATALAEFVADHFVLVHLDTRYAPGADAVLAATGVDRGDVRGLPFIFTVTPQGRFAAALDPEAVETRRDWLIDWFRGYERAALRQALADLHAAAVK